MKKYVVMFCLISLIFPLPAFAEQGVTDDTLILGQSCALSGPAKALGIGMRAGLTSYFQKINNLGGIHGRTIKLISLDDGYEPERAIINTRQLIEKEKIFLAIGYVGTPTSKAAFPIINRFDIPFLAPFTGAEFLRTPFNKNIINLRASYSQEMEKIASYLIETLDIKRIACFYQNDEYGQTGLNGIMSALDKRAVSLVATGTYERNSIAVKSGFLKIQKADPEAVVMVGAYQPCAQFIKVAKRHGLQDTVFCNISFVGTQALMKALGNQGEGTIISQVVSPRWNEDLPIIKEYLEDMIRYNPITETNFVSFEGYLAAKFFCTAAQKAGPNITRINLIDTIEKTKIMDLGGIKLEFDRDDHQGLDDVFLTIIKNGSISPI